MFDLVIKDCTIITMDPLDRVIERGSIGIESSKIAAIGDYDTIRLHGSALTLESEGKIVVPGLVNTHTHLFQTFSKGLGDDVPLFDWFRKAIAPLASLMSEEDCYTAALLGCLDAIKSGTTCINDFMYIHPRPKLSDAVIRAMSESGMRGILSRGIVDAGQDHGLPDAITEDLCIALEDCERLLDTYQGLGKGRIHVWVAPASLWMSTPKAFEESRKIAEKYGAWMTWHASETKSVRDEATRKYGVSDIKLLQRIGFLSEKALAVHCVWLDNEEISILSRNGVKVSHCPVANMYLGDGVAPIPDMLQKGILVGLGTDGAASNNNQDMMSVLKITALLHKVSNLDPARITALTVLKLATIGGAKAVGLERAIGSIEIGKKADLILLNLRKPNTVPSFDPISSIVYSATQENVESVIIDGKIVMRDRKILVVDESRILERAEILANSLINRSGGRN